MEISVLDVFTGTDLKVSLASIKDSSRDITDLHGAESEDSMVSAIDTSPA